MSTDRGASLPTTDLSGAFSKPAGRAGQLSLPARRPTRPAAKPAPATSSDDLTQAPPALAGPPAPSEAPSSPEGDLGTPKDIGSPHEEPQTSQAARGSGARRTSSRSADRPLVLSVPRRIRDRMQAARARGIAVGKPYNYLDQVLDAIEATVDDLPDLVRRGAGRSVTKTGLFEREVVTRPEPEPTVQLTIRGVLPSQFDVIDRLVADTGAEYRSTLIVAALDAALPQA